MADYFMITPDQKRDFNQGLFEFNEKFPNGTIVVISDQTINRDDYVFKTSDSYRCLGVSNVDLFFDGILLSPGSIGRINKGIFNDERMFRLSIKDYNRGVYSSVTIDDYIKRRKEEIKETITSRLDEIKLQREFVHEEKKELRTVSKNVDICWNKLNEKYKK